MLLEAEMENEQLKAPAGDYVPAIFVFGSNNADLRKENLRLRQTLAVGKQGSRN